MTNTEYEAACITAAKVYDRFEGEHKVRQYDEQIKMAEATLVRLQADRREIINRYNLNKCEHEYEYSEVFDCLECSKCGDVRE